ncbi:MULTISPECIES: hypothetical protein [Massilia]|uniref:Uncharacterized protein n=2 Tax=Massilia TaxID=149698 RepID=A0ABY4AC27_9BURK|nr:MULTISPECIES: hypothetical protein [Massilia]NHZ43628.1 hypothetical protein [Massilia aquatica]UOD32343.1 hypothetical protein INH39_12170 [Massilia violaceinigra]
MGRNPNDLAVTHVPGVIADETGRSAPLAPERRAAPQPSAFGLWKKRIPEDGVSYQHRLRDEW